MAQSEFSSDVTVIGLGAMGRILAQTLISHGRRVTVWNRTAARATELEAAGGRVAADPAEAIRASPLTILIVLNGAVVHEILDIAGGAVAGRSLVNLTSGTSDESRFISARVSSAGGRFLKGSILAYPREIGLEDCSILYSGDGSVLDDHQDLLMTLGGGSRFLGEDWERAAAVISALYGQHLAGMGGFLEGAGLIKTVGVSASDYADLLNSVIIPYFKRSLADAARRIDMQDFSGEQATIDIHEPVISVMTERLRSAGIGSQISQAFGGYVTRAQHAGLGGCDISALFEVVRSSS
jgi:3-hydroxyisobutyrate dehydrogenase-like beta-hydroxyacid dehydrogenase